MQRDRTPRKGAQLVSRFEKVRREKRGGKVFKRRYKSICLQVLEYFIGLLEFVVYHDQFDPRDRRNQIVLRRLRQAEEQHQRCKRDILPLRDRPLLPRLPRHPYQPFFEEVQTDSEFAETVWISSESEEEDVPSGIWADPASTARSSSASLGAVSKTRPVIRPAVPKANPVVLRPAVPKANPVAHQPVVPKANPVVHRPVVPKANPVVHRPVVPKANPVVLRPSTAAASGSSASSGSTGRGRTTPRPVWEAWDQAFAGTVITPSEPRVKFSGQVIVSLDWHQVLDIKRRSRGTDRPSPPYTLLPEYEQLIRGLKDRGVAVLVCSYTCSPVYRDQVQSLSWKYPDLFNHIITTENRGREGGKLSALQTITHFGSCHLVHIDDSDEVLDELERYREYRGWPVGNPVGITAVGIKVPRKPQCQGPRYFKNLGDALAQLDTDHLSRQLAEFILTRRTV